MKKFSLFLKSWPSLTHSKGQKTYFKKQRTSMQRERRLWGRSKGLLTIMPMWRQLEGISKFIITPRLKKNSTLWVQHHQERKSPRFSHLKNSKGDMTTTCQKCSPLTGILLLRRIWIIANSCLGRRAKVLCPSEGEKQTLPCIANPLVLKRDSVKKVGKAQRRN